MEKVKRIQVGSQTVGGDGKLFVMAGPCVIEDPERTPGYWQDHEGYL